MSFLICTHVYSYDEVKIRECLEQWNLRKVGIREVGWNRGRFVEFIQGLCDMNVGVAYCACYVNAGFRACGVRKNDLPWASAWSPSWFTDKKTVYKRNKKGKISDVKVMDVFGLWGAKASRVVHMGYILKIVEKKGYILTIEANTSDSGNSWNVGEGVHSRKRSLKQIYVIANHITTSEVDPIEALKVIYHTIQKKETLYRISVRYGVTIREIRVWNNMDDNIIHLGQTLIIKT